MQPRETEVSIPMLKESAKTYPGLILIGLMGSGKSSLGRRLAAHLNLPLIDLDATIVAKSGLSIPEIFAQQGETEFRKLETGALRETIAQHAVIATGGGVVLSKENRALLKGNNAPVVWLKASPEFLANRIEGDTNRPLIASGNTLRKLQELSVVRDPFYEECADFILPRDEMEKQQAMEEIVRFLIKQSNALARSLGEVVKLWPGIL
ncbi:MAG: shikimate kinase [Mariprofundaceae bacterium]|nr:shikimate kinase [Mariprofundaceae bacterium]